jgi:nucleoside-diphosphate-sugar epimerase
VRAEAMPPMEYAEVGDIGPATRWDEALRGVDAVVHLAARVHVRVRSAPAAIAAYRRVNTAGTERLALAAAAAGVRRFVFLSTLKVNGEATQARPFTESDPPAPQDAYARAKWEAEQALHRIGARTGMEVVILRPPLVYGPGVKANFLALLKAVARGLPLPLGAIDNRRSLVYVGNVADAIVKCLEHPAAAGQTFLVRDGEDVSTPELVRRLARALGVKPRLFPVPPSWLSFAGQLTGRRDAVDRLIGSLAIDDAKIREALGWVPPYTLDEGLEATARWFKENLS